MDVRPNPDVRDTQKFYCCYGQNPPSAASLFNVLNCQTNYKTYKHVGRRGVFEGVGFRHLEGCCWMSWTHLDAECVEGVQALRSGSVNLAELFLGRCSTFEICSIHFTIAKTYWNSDAKFAVDSSFLKDVLQKSFVSELRTYMFEGSLAEKLRFELSVGWKSTD